MQSPFAKVAEEVQSINEYIKNKGVHNFDNDPEELKKVSSRVDGILKFATKNGVPLKISTEELMSKLRNTELGEMEEYFEESSEYEDSYDE